MQTEKACKTCHRLVKGNICPICKTSELTPSWKGYILVLKPDQSEIAKMLEITTPGKYALRIGR
jgi:DNA-directed RNA polymerase subunit E"